MENGASDALSREDWVNAAYAAFETGGIQAVKAERLAKELGITRGSFYWHFKNISDLMQAVFDHTAPSGTFATYTAAGFVRRSLQFAGFTVNKIPGYGRKRESLAGSRS